MFGFPAFVVPIGFALYRVGTDAARLAADTNNTLTLMVRATREAFGALGATGDVEIPANLRLLYLCLPAAFVVRYWRRVLASPRGEQWFGAHRIDDSLQHHESWFHHLSDSHPPIADRIAVLKKIEYGEAA